MSNRYQNVISTVGVLLLAAICAKLYVPQTNSIGVSISPPTRGDFTAVRNIKDPAQRELALDALKARTPVLWVRGGDIDVSGEVQITNTVDVEIQRSSYQRAKDRERLLDDYFGGQ